MLEQRAGPWPLLGSALFLASCAGNDAVGTDASALGGAGTHTAADEPSPASPEAPSCDADCLSREYANWPMPNPPGLPWPHGARYARAGELVTEGVTGLEWSQAFVGPVTHAEAALHCSELALDGKDDFRLPTRIELVSLLDRSRVPTIDPLFSDTPSDYFWTATEVAGAGGRVFSVYFGLGETGTGMREQTSAYARCVRAGRRVSQERYEANDAGILDRATGLVWEANGSAQPLERASALLYCSESKDQGAPDWRLPTDQELQTLVDVTRGAPLIDPLFEGTPAATFWALSPPNARPLIVDFASGLAVTAAADEPHFVRCVNDAASAP